MSSLFLDTLSGQNITPPPLWLMRQAGRYLEEYRAVRSSEPDFISFCLNPPKAVEVTLQPIKKFDFDAAIIFSDILMVPWALDRNVRFVTGEGPKLDPMQHGGEITESAVAGMASRLGPVATAISDCRAALPADKALIGFAGAPWTIITYLLEGGSSRDFAIARTWMWENEARFDNLLSLISDATVEFLALQAQAGADVLMLFDSWASAVPAHLRRKVVIDPVNHIVAALRDRGHRQPVIGFPKGIGEGLVAYCNETDIHAVGLDHGVDMRWAATSLPDHLVLQGNLDPLSLIAGGPAMHRATAEILEAMAGRRHIFNLGHGITPQTPVSHVHDLISQVRGTGG
ncbi:MAG: uroporphyrinogen decarboxylase [Candidatus Puniceispirillaceae bacterium]